MRKFRLLSTFTRGLIHRVVVRHPISNAPIPSLAAALVDAPREWSIAVLNGDVVVAGPLDQPAPEVQPQVALSIEDPSVELYLDTDGALNVALDAEEIAHTFDPVAQQIEVRLLTASGAPSTGQDLVVGALTSSASRPMTETATPGTYATDLTTFTPSFHRFEILRSGEALPPTFQLTSYRTTTAVTVIEP